MALIRQRTTKAVISVTLVLLLCFDCFEYISAQPPQGPFGPIPLSPLDVDCRTALSSRLLSGRYETPFTIVTVRQDNRFSAYGTGFLHPSGETWGGDSSVAFSDRTFDRTCNPPPETLSWDQPFDIARQDIWHVGITSDGHVTINDNPTVQVMCTNLHIIYGLLAGNTLFAISLGDPILEPS